MTDLKSIPGLGKSSLELLEAAGFSNADSLARSGADEVFREIERANSVLGISKRPPSRETVIDWVARARDIAGIEDAPAAQPGPVDYEQNPQVISMLATAPFAIPLPARVLVENDLGVSDIPPAILLNHYAGDLDVRVEQRLPVGRNPKPASNQNHYVRIAESASSRLDIDTSKIRAIGDMDEAMQKVAAVKTSPGNDRVALLRAPRSSTNKGRDPQSRWYIRGVLHSHPVSVYVGAVVTLLLMAMIPTAILSGLLLLASVEKPQHFAWVPGWLLVFPATLPVFGLAYLIWGIGGSCRICGQKLFAHRSHLKNSRAHRIPGLGYIVPLCFQIIIFRWFRCTHCGTPVRLKE